MFDIVNIFSYLCRMKTIVVLGMHRSATSLVAKGLDSVIHMGDRDNDLPASESQTEGYYENLKFGYLNNDILKRAGGCWERPPSEERILEQLPFFEDRIKELIKEEGEGHEIWGWKCPRTVLTIRLFHPFLENPHYVACFRNPIDVANSLYNAYGLPHQEGMNCAIEYNHRLVKFLADTHINTYLNKK